MDKKTIQEQRKRGYFIEAAKKIIREEGVGNLTVKKVADFAGFAPGTLYNYFNDLNALLAYCAADFWEECRDYVFKVVKNKKQIGEKIIAACQSYVDYFFDNPNVFKLIFLEELGKAPEEIAEKVYQPEVVFLLGNYFQEGAKAGVIPEENRERLENIVANFIHGILLFFIMERAKETREEMQHNLKENICYLLELC